MLTREWSDWRNGWMVWLQSVYVSPPKRGVGAVSYTHLRAHETVLDLVCRLLLEKKKTVLVIESRVLLIIQ